MYLGVIVKTPGEIADTFAGPQRYRLQLLPNYLYEPQPNIVFMTDDAYPQVVIVRPDGAVTTTPYRHIVAHLNFHYDYRLSHAPSFFSDEMTFDASVGDLPVGTLIFMMNPREAAPYLTEGALSVTPLEAADALSVYRWMARYDLRPWLARYADIDPVTGESTPPDWVTTNENGEGILWLSLAIKRPQSFGIPPEYGIILHEDIPVGIAQWERPVGVIEDMLGYDADVRIWQLDLLLGEPLFQRRGIGTTTARSIAGWLCQHRDAQKVIATPALGNAAAISCFERAGFVALHTQGISIGDGTWRECLVMEWNPE